MEELFRGPSKTSLKEIIFNPVYKYFALSWTNEINRNFIAISCFAQYKYLMQRFFQRKMKHYFLYISYYK